MPVPPLCYSLSLGRTVLLITPRSNNGHYGSSSRRLNFVPPQLCMCPWCDSFCIQESNSAVMGGPVDSESTTINDGCVCACASGLIQTNLIKELSSYRVRLNSELEFGIDSRHSHIYLQCTQNAADDEDATRQQTARVRAAWIKFHEYLPILTGKGFS